MTAEHDQPFADLPAGLVDTLLAQTNHLSEQLHGYLEHMYQARDEWRRQLTEANLLLREGDLPSVPVPTTCGIDGAYALERLVMTDLIAIAAVAVEGLTPPREPRYWPEPRHRAYMQIESHEEETSMLARAVMVGMELELAVEAPHDAVFLDGSMTTPLIYLNQALSRAAQAPQLHLSEYLYDHIVGYLRSYATLLEAVRSDKVWVALPKYSVRREIGEHFQWPQSLDDKAMLTNLLQAGEYVPPQRLQSPQEPWHIKIDAVPQKHKSIAQQLEQKIITALNQVHVVYYRPHSWLPALRLEMSYSIARNRARLAAVLQAVRFQCSAPSMLEPYPLYLADRMVKHLGRAIQALRQVANQHLAEQFSGDISQVFLNLHGYRTESGQ